MNCSSITDQTLVGIKKDFRGRKWNQKLHYQATKFIFVITLKFYAENVYPEGLDQILATPKGAS